MFIRVFGALLVLAFALAAKQPLLVISVDGLDNRYLAEADRMGLKIPHIRRMMAEGQWAERGVLGVVPTITWPSHTTLITGVTPTVHGILGNRLPGGDYPWSAHLLKARTLLDAAHQAGLTTAVITWPVTVDAPVDFNLPEYFTRRRGGAMDLRSIESKSMPPGLVDEIARAYPSFGQEWMDDRTRTLATAYLLRRKSPDLLLVHLVDLDSEEHDDAPFTREANSVLEYTDELIGTMLEAKPAGMAVALLSDHGFERVHTTVNLAKLAADAKVSGIVPRGAVALAQSSDAADFLRKLAAEKQYGIGRQVPADEIRRFAPEMSKAAAVFESADGFEFFGKADDPVFGKPREIGNHGHWPTRYRAVFLLSEGGGAPSRLGELEMTSIAGHLATVLGIAFQPGPK